MENIWTSGCGRLELNLNADQAARGYHSGQCDADIAELKQVPEIKAQLLALDIGLVRECLREYGAWDSAELSNHSDNLDRLLWIACADIVDREVEND
jgi:hypothetical protein